MIGYCTACEQPGVPYEYQGKTFDGLCAFKGERLCPPCRDALMDVEGVDILIVDDRPGMMPIVWNTVRDKDKILLTVPFHLRGVDGRDSRYYRSKTRKRGSAT